MPSNLYHFEDHWHIPFPIEDVWNLLSKPEKYPSWWKGIYLSATTLDESRVAIVSTGWLPYKLRFVIETVRRERPHLIEFKASGDFRTDSSRWLLQQDGSGTHVTLDWNPMVDKPVIKLFSPVLKPVFEWNHHWAMRIGEQEMVKFLHAISRDTDPTHA